MIQQVVDLGQDLDVHVFAQRCAFREPCIGADGARITVVVAGHAGDAIVAARTIEAVAKTALGLQPIHCIEVAERGDRSAGVHTERQTGLCRDSRCCAVAVQQDAEKAVGMDRGAHHQVPGRALTNIEVGWAVLCGKVGRVHQVVGVSEGRLVLVEVRSVGVGVVCVEFEMAAHVVLNGDDGGFVFRIGLAEDVGDLLVVGVEPAGKEFRPVGERERPGSGWILDLVGNGTDGRGIDIGVDEVWELPAEAGECTDGEVGAKAQLLLDGELGLVNLGRLKPGIEEDCGRLDRVCDGGCEDVGKLRRSLV